MKRKVLRKGIKVSSGMKEHDLDRRKFLQFGSTAFGAAAFSTVSNSIAASLLSSAAGQTFDYIVIGSGPGGGPVAANLARAGYTVALLEAGLDPAAASTLDDSTLATYLSPSSSLVASEHKYLSWDMFVKHYGNLTQAMRNSKYVPDKGILYPRGSALGGSAAHNGCIWVYPHDADFDHIAELTGDDSWRSKHMRRYFKRVEKCEYLENDAPGHGFDGYISSAVRDHKIFELFPVLNDISFAGAKIPLSYYQGNTRLDVNHPAVAAGETGTYLTPMHASYNQGKIMRSSVREYLLETQRKYPDKLFIITGALASKVIFENRKAIGVEYMPGTNLYKASKGYNPSHDPGRYSCYARREVIVAGGAYNTPQLLKLSGIGPKEELSQFGISVVRDLPGVGRNLQDRYEIHVTVELNEELGLWKYCSPGTSTDPCAAAYATGSWVHPTSGPFYGPYAFNAVLATRIEKSSHARLPDLFMLGVPSPFKGYYPGVSLTFEKNKWSWLILKAHNKNNAGTVKLRSADPRDVPEINFRYFEEGSDSRGDDITAVAEGIRMVRTYLAHPTAAQHIKKEISPGKGVQSEEDLRQYVRDQAWGHHASCSAPIGADNDPMAVLDSRFRVRGVKNLRIVDASIFPCIPGFFPMTSIYMISEKASDVILEDARKRHKGDR